VNAARYAQLNDLLKQADLKLSQDSDHLRSPDAQQLPWLIAQLVHWPVRVDEQFTTNMRFLMLSAAAILRHFQRTEVPVVLERKRMVCSRCGSTNVLRDAYAEWDITKQDWVLQNVFDHAVCDSEKCNGYETRIDEELIEEKEDGDSVQNSNSLSD
jgi:hypothetical protein